MTTTASIVILGLLSAVGFSVSAALPPQATTDALPWKDIAGGGAALLLLAALVVFLRFLSQDRSARDTERQKDREHVEKIVDDCTAMTRQLGADFSTAQTQLINSVREDHQAARRELQDLVRDLRRPA